MARRFSHWQPAAETATHRRHVSAGSAAVTVAQRLSTVLRIPIDTHLTLALSIRHLRSRKTLATAQPCWRWDSPCRDGYRCHIRRGTTTTTRTQRGMPKRPPVSLLDRFCLWGRSLDGGRRSGFRSSQSLKAEPRCVAFRCRLCLFTFTEGDISMTQLVGNSCLFPSVPLRCPVALALRVLALCLWCCPARCGRRPNRRHSERPAHHHQRLVVSLKWTSAAEYASRLKKTLQIVALLIKDRQIDHLLRGFLRSAGQ